MSRHLIDNGSVHGELIDPPTYESEFAVECAQCFVALDEDDDTIFWLKDQSICLECVTVCDACGEYITDETMRGNGPEVRFRRWEMDGKLSDPHHALCAAIAIIADLSGDSLFDPEQSSLAEITELIGVPVLQAVN